MNDFSEVMRQWKRMCDAYEKLDNEDPCNAGCPLGKIEQGCGAIFEMSDATNWRDVGEKVMACAKQHPEPIYPTWFEWLREIGVVKNELNRYSPTAYQEIYGAITREHIPAGIAEKLGLKPRGATP